MGAVFIILSVFWSFFYYSYNVASDFSYLSKAELLSRFDFPRIWQERISEGLGQNSISILWNWPLDFLYGLFAKFGFNFSSIEIILFVLPFAIAGYFSINNFFKYFGVGKTGRLAGSLFYLLNSYILLVIDGGQFSIALAYVLLPMVYVLFVKSTESNFKKKIITSLAFIVLGFLDIRFIYILFIFLIFHYLYFVLILNRRRIFDITKKWLTSFSVVLIIFVLFNLYWILPAIFVGPPTLPQGYTNISQTEFLSFADWRHALMMQTPNWYENIFGKINSLRPEFLFIPILVLSGAVLGRKKKYAYYFTTLSGLGIFLVIGANSPLPHTYPYLFSHIPGFSLFRDPSKFFILITLSYAYFIGIFSETLNYKLNFKLLGRKLYPVSIILIIYILYLCRPVWLGKMTGTFTRPLYETGFRMVWDELNKDKDFGRVLWLPAQPPLGYSSINHPSLEALRIVDKRPFVIGIVGNYEIFNFIREADFMGDIFNLTGIKYLVYPYYDTRKQEVKKDNADYYYAFLDQLKNLPWIESVKVNDNVALLQNKNSQERFFIADNSFIVVGSDGIYSELVKIPEFKLSKNTLLFAEERPGLTNNLLQRSGIKVVINDKSKLDALFSTLPQEYFIFPAAILNNSPDNSGLSAGNALLSNAGWTASITLRSNAGWWKRESADFLWMRNFLQEKYGIDNADFDYGGGWAIAEGNKSLQISGKNFGTGKRLFARVLFSKSGGSLTFYQDGKPMNEKISTREESSDKSIVKLTGYKNIPDRMFEYDKGRFVWVDAGVLNGNGDIVIEAEGKINIVNSLVAITDAELSHLEGNLTNDRIIDLQKLTESQKKELFIGKSATVSGVSYERISPTHYKLKVWGLEKPGTLVFSETYDKYWKLGDATPFPAYSLLNGFYIDKNGDYDLYYEPQKWVNIGFIITIITVMGIPIFLFIKRSKNLV